MQNEQIQESESEEVSNDTLMSELVDLREDEPNIEPERAEAAPTEEAEAETEVEEAEQAEEEAPKEEEALDAKTERTLERIHEAEKKSRTAIDSERAELTKERAALADELAQSKAQGLELVSAQKRAKYDPAGLLAKYGVTEPADMMAAARQLYAMAGSDKATPEQKEAAQRTLRSRESDDEMAEMKAEMTRMREEISGKERSAVEAQNIKHFTDGVVSAVSDTSPIVANMLKRAPGVARAKIKEHAEDLLNQTGEVPDAVDVIKSFEEAERKALSDRGYDPDLAVKRPEATNPTAGEKRPVSIGNNLRTPTTPPDEEEELTGAELDEQIAKELRELRA